MRNVVNWIMCFLVSIYFNTNIISQKSLDTLAQDVVYYSDIVANAQLNNSKIKANSYLVNSIELFLNAEGSFDYMFDSDVWLSMKSPVDNSFKIITWQLRKTEDEVIYFGYIQMKDGTTIMLNDKSEGMDDVAYSMLDNEYWYGALYYNMLEQKDASGSPYYILFGYHEKDKFSNTKLAEVLYFDDGNPVFGKEVFSKEDEGGRADKVNRLILEYSADANVTLNYNPGLGMIVYDHLISRMGNMPGQGPTMLPDGSYCGYQLSEGEWKYVDKLFDQISETAPRPKPVLGGKGKSIFGKKN